MLCGFPFQLLTNQYFWNATKSQIFANICLSERSIVLIFYDNKFFINIFFLSGPNIVYICMLVEKLAYGCYFVLINKYWQILISSEFATEVNCVSPRQDLVPLSIKSATTFGVRKNPWLFSKTQLLICFFLLSDLSNIYRNSNEEP